MINLHKQKSINNLKGASPPSVERPRQQVVACVVPASACWLSLRAKAKGPNRQENGPLGWALLAKRPSNAGPSSTSHRCNLRSHLELGGHHRRPEDSRVGVVLAGGDLGRPPLLAV